MITGEAQLCCDDCGATNLQFPEWCHDQALIACQGCGKAYGTVGQLRERLLAELRSSQPPECDRLQLMH